MKKALILLGVMSVVVLISCDKPKRSPGRTYMPDMAYSRAFETYAELDSHRFTTSATERGGKIFYNATPVAGSVARGEMPNLYMVNDTTGYKAAATIKNPLAALDSLQMKEAERLYLINCGICHGAKLDGQGPLFKSGVFVAAPRNFVGDPLMKAMTEGTMFHAVTFGKGQMGSYASQLSSRQRWMVISYVKMKQLGDPAVGGTVGGADSVAVKDTTNK